MQKQLVYNLVLKNWHWYCPHKSQRCLYFMLTPRNSTCWPTNPISDQEDWTALKPRGHFDMVKWKLKVFYTIKQTRIRLQINESKINILFIEHPWDQSLSKLLHFGWKVIWRKWITHHFNPCLLSQAGSLAGKMDIKNQTCTKKPLCQ